MKKSMNPRKKYLNGSNSGGVTPNGIPSPASTLNDYQIMMAKAEQEAASNEWLPIVAMVGGLAQQAVGAFGGSAGTAGTAGALKDNAGSLVTKAANPATDKIMLQGAPGIVAANGNNNVNQDVEVEGGEMYETPQGQTGEFEGPSHEQGGIPMEVNKDIPEGTKVYSDRLKVGKETLAERKANREKKIANLEKIASEPLVDSAMKNATKRKMEAIQKEEAADLAYQEQINNIQQMADSVVKAFGTSVEGVQANPIGASMKYEDGTGPAGIVYGKGYNADMFKDFYAKYNQLNPGGVMDMNFIQGDLGIESKTPGFGKMFGPTTYKASQDWLAANKDKLPDGYVTGQATSPVTTGDNTPVGFAEGFGMDSSGYTGDMYARDPAITEAEDDMAFYTPGGVGTPIDNPEGTMFSRALGKAGKGIGNAATKIGTAVNKSGGVPGIGDLTSLFGDYLGATSGLKNAAEQRASDVTHQNVYANAGKDAQTYLDKAMGNVEAMKDQAIMKATTATRGSKASANNSARGVNQKRGMNWLYDQGLADNVAAISANAANQVADIFKTKSTTSLSADQLKGQGEYQAKMANEAAKDAYFTAKGLGLKDQALGVQHIGKDLNAMKQNKMIENLMKNYGTYVTADMKTGNLNNKPLPATSNSTEEIFTDAKGVKYKKNAKGQLIQIK